MAGQSQGPAEWTERLYTPGVAQVVTATNGEIGEQGVRVRVRLFASYRDAAGTGTLEERLPAGSRVHHLVERLVDRVPALKAGKGLIAVNREYVGPDLTLHDGDEVAFLPPVSGGADACSRL